MKKIVLLLLIFTSTLAQGQKEDGATAQQMGPSESELPDLPLAKADKADKDRPDEKNKIPGPLIGIIEDYTYIPEGKRDPFSPFDSQEQGINSVGPMFPLQRYDLDQLRLVGIIWDVKNPKAMMMDPQKKGHVVKVNDRVGRNNGYVARIREGEIVVIESFKSNDGKVSYQTQVVKLSSD